jgi:hypothetical protein
MSPVAEATADVPRRGPPAAAAAATPAVPEGLEDYEGLTFGKVAPITDPNYGCQMRTESPVLYAQ